MTTSERLADFVTGLRFSDLPAAVVEKAKEIALHSWGVQLGASTLPWCKAMHRFVADQGGAPQSTVANYGGRTSVTNAALVNGTFSHGFELDDNHARTGVKGGSVLVPTALAVGEERLSSGKELITALVAGFEVITRAGVAVGPSTWRRNTHMTGTVGALAAAAVTAKLRGLDREAVVHALGLGAAHRVGYQEGPPSGRGDAKRAFCGMAAQAGIRAALLAEGGMRGALTTLDAGSGLCAAYEVEPGQDAVLTRGLGQDWEILDVHYKIWAQDGYIQPMTEALERIRREHSFAVEDIEQVWVGSHRRAVENVVGVIREPRSITDAQFSAFFSVALYLVAGGAALDEYTPEALADPRVIELSRRVVLEVDDEVEAEFQATRPRGAKVAVRLKSGQEHRATVHHLRSQSPEELDQKFRTLAERVLEPGHAQRLLEQAHGLEAVHDVSAVARLLVADRP